MPGEHPRGREAIDKMTGRLVQGGTDPKKAAELAKAAALREDRRRNK